MRIVFLGSGSFARPTLKWLAHSEHQVPLVVTQPARRSGRGRRLAHTPVSELAAELGLETMETDNVNAPQMLDRLSGLEVRAGVVVAFGQMLRVPLMNCLPAGFINLHASLLPKLRGAAPINWAIINGEGRTGCTVFRIVRGMDAGPILTWCATDIEPAETAGELHDRLAVLGVDAVRDALRLLAGNPAVEGTPQDEAQATGAPKLSKADGHVDFARRPEQVANFICGMTPWPGASACYGSSSGRWERVTLMRARASEGTHGGALAPGTIDGRFHVAVQEGFVEILEIKPSSGRGMRWHEYENGRHVAEGDRMEPPAA